MRTKNLLTALGLDPEQCRQALAQASIIMHQTEQELGRLLSGVQNRLAKAGQAVRWAGGGIVGKPGQAALRAVRLEAQHLGLWLDQAALRAENARAKFARLGAASAHSLGKLLVSFGEPLGKLFFQAGQWLGEKLENLDQQMPGAWAARQKEEQKKQAFIQERVSGEDIGLYREARQAMLDLQLGLAGLAITASRTLAPAMRSGLGCLQELIEWVGANEDRVIQFIGVLAGVIGAALVPVLVSMGAALAANPITWIVGGLILLGVLINDLITYIRGGEAALGNFWSIFGSGEEMIQGVMALWEKAKTLWESVCSAFGPVFGKAMGELQTPLAALGEVFKNAFGAIQALVEGDIDGMFGYLAKAAWNLINSIFDYERIVISTSGNLINTILEKAFEGAASWIKKIITDLADTPVLSEFLPSGLLDWAAGKEDAPPQNQRQPAHTRRDSADGLSWPSAALANASEAARAAGEIIYSSEAMTAAAVPAGSRSNTNIDSKVNVAAINIATAATDAGGIAAHIGQALQTQLQNVGVFAAEGGVRQ